MVNQYKEVYFDVYCKSCQYQQLREDEHPCHNCLSTPANIYSHKPINWKEKEKRNGRTGKTT